MSPARLNRTIQPIADALIVIGLVAAMTAILVLTIEVGEWLSSSEWPGWSVEDGLALFGIERGDVPESPGQRMLDVMLAVPLTIALFLGGVYGFLAGLNLGDWGLDRERRDFGLLSDD